MGNRTKIEWVKNDDGTQGATWNPVTGCTKVSQGCKNCYAEREWPRLTKLVPAYADRKFTDVRTHADRLDKPLHWKRPRRIFVNSMSDLFHEDVPFEFIDKVFVVMALAPQHTFQVLTKRPARMLEYFQSFHDRAAAARGFNVCEWADSKFGINDAQIEAIGTTPKGLPNVWLGVSVEDQAAADERIPLLLQTPSAVRWISAEPLLGPVSFRQWQHDYGCDCGWGGDDPLSYCTVCGWRGSDSFCGDKCPCCSEVLSDYNACPDCDGHDGDEMAFGPNSLPHLDWVVVGGESGPFARPMNPAWVRGLRDQCSVAGVAFLFKQWGEWGHPDSIEATGTVHHGWWEICRDDGGVPCHEFPDRNEVFRVGKKHAGRLLDGVQHDGYPE